MRTEIEWKRFWGEGAVEFALDASGFLADPQSQFYPQNSALRSLDHYQQSSCLILLGELGIGKTSEIRRWHRALQQSGKSSRMFNLGEYEGGTLHEIFDDPVISEWQSGTGILHLWLDSFDEALMSMQTLGDILYRRLERWDLKRLCLRVVCRSAIWPSTTEEKLRNLLPIHVLTMAPLTFEDALVAAKAWGITEPDMFLSSVQTAGATGFALKPGTLDFLVKEYLANGQLPATEVDLFNKGCRQLCSEPIERLERRSDGRLSADQRLVIAGRIAALMLSCGKAFLCDSPIERDLRDPDLSFDVVLRGLEMVPESAIPLMRTHVAEVASCGLFRPAGTHRVCWAHHSYAEHLAAMYMSHALRTEQIMMLIVHPAGSNVIPQLSGLAGRLAAMNARVFQGLVADNPDLLLDADVKYFSETQREALVKALLKSLSAGELPVRWDRVRRYHLLCHRSLAASLRAFLSTGNFQARLAAIDIAGACKCLRLGNLLLKIALDPNEEAALREGAIEAVAEIGDDQLAGSLRQLVIDAALDDPNSQVKGTALRRLWNVRLISADDVFGHLAAPDPSFHGAYDRFIADLPESLVLTDFAPAFRWIKTQPGWAQQEHLFQDLTDKILASALAHLGHNQMTKDLIGVIRSRIHQNRLTGWAHGESTFKGALRLTAQSLRRRFIEEFATQLEPSDFNEGLLSFATRDLLNHTLSSSDFTWLLRNAAEEPAGIRKQFFAGCARLAWDNADPAAYDAAFEAQKTDSTVAQVFSRDFGYVLLDSDAARLGRELLLETQPSAPKDRSTIDVDLDQMLDKVEAGEVDYWWKISVNLTWATPDRAESEWTEDIRRLPGWTLAHDNRRRRFLNAALLYIMRGAHEGEDWTRSDRRRPAAAAYRAMLLLENELPEIEIPDAVLASWAPAVLSYPTLALANEMRDADRLIVQRVISAAGPAVRTFLDGLMSEPDQRQRVRDLIRRVVGLENTELDSFFENLLNAYTWPTALEEALLSHLMDRNSAVALRLAETMIERPFHGQDALDRALSAARILLKRAPEFYWQILWKRARNSAALASKLIEQLTSWILPNVSLMGRLDEKQLESVYVWLYRRHPENRHLGPIGGGPLRMVQYSIPGHLAARGTEQAVAALEKIVRKVGRAPELDHYLAEARRRLLAATWTPIEPDSFLQLLMDHQKRYVSTSEQLALVVTEVLTEFQTELQGTPPLAPLLWETWETGHTTSKLAKRMTRSTGQRPKEEEAISDFLAVALRGRLQNRRIVVNREVQIRRGQQTDIHIEAPASVDAAGESTPPRVIVEVKGCWNKDVKTDIEEQLVKRYLEKTDRSAGIYVVGWFNCTKWREPPGSRPRRGAPAWTIDRARHYFENRAVALTQPGRLVLAVVLDTAIHT